MKATTRMLLLQNRGADGPPPLEPVLYLNTVTGNNANDGLTPATARQTYASIKGLITATYSRQATVLITAPLTAPVSFSFFGDQFVSGDNIQLRSLTPGVKWYGQGFTRLWTSGWSAAGGGVYSIGGGAANSGEGYVWATLLDSDGFYTPLIRNTVTPTTPAEGEFGDNGTNMYVHLPGGANPNSYRLYRPRFTPGLLVDGTATVYIQDMILQFSSDLLFTHRGSGLVEIRDSDVEYTTGSCVQTPPTATGTLICRNVRARRAILNDGFNANGPVGRNIMRLISCEGAYNGDEGVSPHDGTDLYISGGHYYHNGESGLAATGTSFIDIRNARFSYNNQSASDPVYGGIALFVNSNGTIDNCQVDNNLGPGLYCDTAGVVTVTGLNSFDNAEPDTLC